MYAYKAGLNIVMLHVYAMNRELFQQGPLY